MRLRVGGNLYNSAKSNFGPEFGFAWSPTLYQGKVVVRGGFGLNFTGEEFAVLANGGTNPPLVIQPNFSSVSPTQINPSSSTKSSTTFTRSSITRPTPIPS